MKRLILGILIITFFTGSLFAQRGKKMEAQKVAFITNYLELTPEEAETFWPVYRQFQKEKRTINRRYKSDQSVKKMTDEELEAQMLSSFQMDQEQLDLKKEYFEKMKKVLPIRKLAMLRDAERKFKTNILDTIKERRQERRRNRMNQNN